VLSAVRAQRDRLGLRYGVPEDQVAMEHAVAAARAAEGGAAFATVWDAGRMLTPAQAIAAALTPLEPAISTRRISLTPREDEILRLLVAGQTDPAIAAALFISVRTVEHHVARLFAKLGVHTRAAAATAAIANRLVDPTSPPS
jgi:DNA-binding NarL/FixJ family response regulator